MTLFTFKSGLLTKPLGRPLIVVQRMANKSRRKGVKRDADKLVAQREALRKREAPAQHRRELCSGGEASSFFAAHVQLAKGWRVASGVRLCEWPTKGEVKSIAHEKNLQLGSAPFTAWLGWGRARS